MKLSIPIAATAAALALCAGAARSDVASSAPPDAARVSIDLDNASLVTVARALSTQTGARVLVAPGSIDRLTLHVAGIPFRSALEVVKTALNVRVRTLWLRPETARRFRPDQAMALLRTLDGLNGPVVSEDGRQSVLFRSSAGHAAAADVRGLQPVYVLIGHAAPPPRHRTARR